MAGAWRGSHDCVEQIALIFGRGEELPKSYGTWAATNASIPTDDPKALIKFFLCGVGYCHRNRISIAGTQGGIKILCVAIKHSLAPHLPADEKETGNVAVVSFMADVWGYMVARITNDRWTDIDQDKYAAAKAAQGRLHGLAWLPEELTGYAGNPPQAATLAGCVALMAFLMDNLSPAVDHIPALAFVCTYVGLAKRGTITDSKLDTISEALRQELGYDIRMSTDHLQKVYLYFGKYIDEDNAEQVFTTWATAMQGYSLRLQITMNQALGGGLTAINIIKAAIQLFPDFSWPRVFIMLPNDTAHAIDALRTIGGNQYYGFKHDLSQVASTKYKSLAYVAKELLKRYGGPDYGQINNYAGWTRNPLHKARLDEIIQAYNPGLDDATIAAREEQGVERLAEIRAAINN